MNNNQTYGTTRERSMEELKNMYRYFSIKKAAYEEFDRLDRDVSAPIRVRSAGKVWGMIFLIFGCACIFFAVAAGTSEAFTAVAILIGIGIILLASRSSKIKKLQQDKQTKLQRMKTIAQELAVHYNNY